MLQAAIRSFVAQSRFQRIKQAAVAVQSAARGLSARKSVAGGHAAAVVVQAALRRYLSAQKYEQTVKAVVTMQRFRRGQVQQARYAHTLSAAVRIQSVMRCHAHTKAFEEQVTAAVVVQSRCRSHLAQQQYQQTRSCTKMLQAAIRSFVAQLRAAKATATMTPVAQDLRRRSREYVAKIFTQEVFETVFAVSNDSAACEGALLLVLDQSTDDCGLRMPQQFPRRDHFFMEDGETTPSTVGFRMEHSLEPLKRIVMKLTKMKHSLGPARARYFAKIFAIIVLKGDEMIDRWGLSLDKTQRYAKKVIKCLKSQPSPDEHHLFLRPFADELLQVVQTWVESKAVKDAATADLGVEQQIIKGKVEQVQDVQDDIQGKIDANSAQLKALREDNKELHKAMQEERQAMIEKLEQQQAMIQAALGQQHAGKPPPAPRPTPYGIMRRQFKEDLLEQEQEYQQAMANVHGLAGAQREQIQMLKEELAEQGQLGQQEADEQVAEAQQEVDQRVAEAQQEADQRVAEAQQEADQRVAEAQQEVDQRVAEAQQQAMTQTEEQANAYFRPMVRENTKYRKMMANLESQAAGDSGDGSGSGGVSKTEAEVTLAVIAQMFDEA
eukprot:g1803.t1